MIKKLSTNYFKKRGLMPKRSLLIYSLAIIVLIAVGGLVWWKNQSSADENQPNPNQQMGRVTGKINGPDETMGLTLEIYLKPKDPNQPEPKPIKVQINSNISHYIFDAPYGTYVLNGRVGGTGGPSVTCYLYGLVKIDPFIINKPMTRDQNLTIKREIVDPKKFSLKGKVIDAKGAGVGDLMLGIDGGGYTTLTEKNKIGEYSTGCHFPIKKDLDIEVVNGNYKISPSKIRKDEPGDHKQDFTVEPKGQNIDQPGSPPDSIPGGGQGNQGGAGRP